MCKVKECHKTRKTERCLRGGQKNRAMEQLAENCGEAINFVADHLVPASWPVIYIAYLDFSPEQVSKEPNVWIE